MKNPVKFKNSRPKKRDESKISRGTTQISVSTQLDSLTWKTTLAIIYFTNVTPGRVQPNDLPTFTNR
jgi:hypothetical protein